MNNPLGVALLTQMVEPCGSLIPFTRANAQWDIHGFN